MSPTLLLRPQRPYIPLLTLLFLMGLHEQQLCCMGLHNHSSLISAQECYALAHLARQSHLSTNCNCTQQLSSSLKLCGGIHGQCLPSRTRQRFVSCTGGSSNAPVSELYLSNMSLEGNLSWVTNFRHIKHLDVSLNNLSGEIPSAMWSLSKLTHVNLSFNSFSEHNIPKSTVNNSALTNYPLRALDFSHNQMRAGPFPQDLCTRFPNLSHLILSSNLFNGSVNLSACHRLEALDASFNQLQGSPFHYLHAPSTLKFLRLKHNLFSGSVPSLSRRFPLLVDLDISFNNFTGDFGSEGYSLPTSLSELNVSHNSLEVGFSPQMIYRFGMSSFWPNTACKGCVSYVMSPSPSPSPSVSAAAASPPPFQTGSDSSVTHRLDAVLGIIVGCMAGFIFITITACLIFHKRRQKPTWLPCRAKRPIPPFKHGPEIGPFSFESQSGTWVADVKNPSSVPVVIFEKPLMNLTFSDLLQATKSFDREYEVAGDGTGLVYACVLPGVLEGDAKVTIEVVEDGASLSAEAAHAAFTAMGEIKHDNLVPLLGYCIVGEEKLLIYQHMEGGSLEDVLHAVPEEAQLPNVSAILAEDWNNIESWPDHNELHSNSCALDTSTGNIDWENRHRIALGVARALAYLHNGCRRPVVHGALSSSCILLDGSSSKAMVANYAGAWGLRRRLTPGYVAPEYKETAHTGASASHSSKRGEYARPSSCGDAYAYTTKCDVYGVGVVLLELATGRRAVGNYGASSTLVAWVRGLKKGKRAEEAVDPRLPATSHPCLLEMINVGYLCTADSPSKRPSMQQVVGLLNDLAAH